MKRSPAHRHRHRWASAWPRRRGRGGRLRQAKQEEAAMTLALLALVLDCFTDLSRYPRCSPWPSYCIAGVNVNDVLLQGMFSHGMLAA